MPINREERSGEACRGVERRERERGIINVDYYECGSCWSVGPIARAIKPLFIFCRASPSLAPLTPGKKIITLTCHKIASFGKDFFACVFWSVGALHTCHPRILDN
jgi:hypothetical protein